MSRTIELYRRSDGERVETFDWSALSDRDQERAWDGMVMRIDFSEFMPVDSRWPQADQDEARTAMAARRAEHDRER